MLDLIVLTHAFTIATLPTSKDSLYSPTLQNTPERGQPMCGAGGNRTPVHKCIQCVIYIASRF